MSDAGITIVKPGQSISEAVKQDIQQTAAAKQIVEMKRQMTPRFVNVLNSLFQNLSAIPDPDFAGSICISYAAGLALGTGTTKENYLKGAEKAWEQEVEQAEAVKVEQRKMLLNVAKNMMAQKRPIPPPFVEQMKALGCEFPADLQAFIDSTPAAPAEAAAAAPASPVAEVKN